MKTNPLNLSRMIATIIAVITLPSFAQDAPKPEAPNGEPRMMRPSGDRMPNRTAADAPKPWRIGLIVEPLDPALRNDLARHRGAMKLYRSQLWDQAEAELFNLSRSGRPHKVYEIFLERIQYLRANPPGAQWDGAFTFTHK